MIYGFRDVNLTTQYILIKHSRPISIPSSIIILKPGKAGFLSPPPNRHYPLESNGWT